MHDAAAHRITDEVSFGYMKVIQQPYYIFAHFAPVHLGVRGLVTLAVVTAINRHHLPLRERLLQHR